MPSDRDDHSDDRSGDAGGTPYRALLAEGDGAFDVTLDERGGTLTLQPASETGDEDDEANDAPAPPEEVSEEVAYRFEHFGESSGPHHGHALLVVNGRSVPVTITEAEAGAVRVTIDGRTATVRVQDETDLLLERFGIAAGAGTAEAEIRAPMPGLVVRVLVEEGQQVSEGDGLLVLEAMKMENELRAPAAGTVTALHAAEGASAGKGEVLVEVEAA